jgi:mannose-6-phosphate isomerase-like protein (cupin superfamily)
MAEKIPITRRDDLPVETFGWGTLQWLCNGKLIPGATQTLGWCEIAPGRRNPVHYHPNCEEVLYMLSGVGRHHLDDEFVELRAGMTIRIPANVRHNLENTGSEPIECLIAFSSGDRQTVFLE